MISRFKEKYSEVIEHSKNRSKYLLVYKIGPVSFCIPVNEVVDVVANVETRKIPGSAEFFKGIFLYDEKPVFLLDAALVLSLHGESATEVMIVNLWGGELYGITITGISQVIPLDESLKSYTPGDNEIIHPVFVDKAYEINQNAVYQLKMEKLFSRNNH